MNENENNYVPINPHENYPDSDQNVEIPAMKVIPLKKICMTIGNLPTSYLETMTYYEMLVWFIEYLKNNIIPTINNNASAVQEVQSVVLALQNYINAYKDSIDSDVEELEEYMNNYFDNLDVQEEINNKLDQMLEDGVLEQIIEQFLQSTAIWSFDTIADMKSATNLINGSTAKTLGYYSINDGGGALYQITDTASQSDYQEELNSGLYATLIVENSELNVKQFGAYGDDSHDDTTAIQSAINYANTSNNKTIFIPNGTYLCNIIVYPNTEIKGEIGSILKSVANNGLDVIKSYDFDDLTGTTTAIPVDEGLYNFKLTNLTIDGNLVNSSAGYGIKIFGRNMKFSNVNVKNCKTGGIYTEFGTHNAPTYGDDSFYSDLLESVFEKIKVFNCLGDGWTYKGPHDSHIKYYICVKCQGWALNGDNATSNGLIIENLNSWWCDNGVVLQNGRLSNCQIDGGSYDGTGSSANSIGLKLRNDGGGAFISNCSIGSWGIGAELGGSGHIINGLSVRHAIDTNIHITNMAQSLFDFKVLTNKTGTNILKFDSSGSNQLKGYITAPAGNTLFAGTSPLLNATNGINITSILSDYICFQVPSTSINAAGWTPKLPLSNGTLIPDNKVPTTSSRGGVLQQNVADYPAGETATTDQLNSILASLRTAGVFSQNT